MKHFVPFAASALAAAVVLTLCPGPGEVGIYRDVLRLRVIARSDSEEDQAAKLAVRDAVLALIPDRLGDCASCEEAEAEIFAMGDEIAKAAEETLAGMGESFPVTLSLGREWSPRRDYGSAVLPAGMYRTLRVTIGKGEGHNWWCVLFPGICVRYASKEDDSIPVGLTPEEYRIITSSGNGPLRVRFWVLEKIAELCRSFE